MDWNILICGGHLYILDIIKTDGDKFNLDKATGPDNVAASFDAKLFTIKYTGTVKIWARSFKHITVFVILMAKHDIHLVNHKVELVT